jgi:para-aminobenzoate synthetase/4-amino-4-deoxychorismate lyase
VEISGSGQRRRAELGVGAGITAGSTPVLEWWECLDKAAPLAGAVNAAVVAPGPSRTAHAGLEQAGVFETMLVLDGRVIDLDAHLARLRDSVSELWDARLPASAGAQLTDQAARLPSPAARLRVDIVCEADGNVRVTSRSGRTMRPAPSVCQSGERLRVATLADGIGRHKWADRSVLDALEARHRGQQVLVVDGDGLSLETTRGNLLIFNGCSVATPPLDGRILPGITRRTVLDLARTIGLDVDVRPVPLGELVAADGVAVCGSLSGLVWVRWCPAGSWTAPAPALAELSDALLARWEKR